MNFTKTAVAFILLSALAALSACSYVPRIVSEYKIDIQQGNVLTQDMVAQLRPGLTKDQVRFVLGTPLLTDMYHANRWDYLYRLQKGSGEIESRKFSVFFDGEGKLARVAGDVSPTTAEDAAQVPEQKTREIDLGSIEEGATAPAIEEKGWFGQVWEKVF